ncbi:MAG: hypothetical protein HY905_23610 [Deltaproteobacteria bacterium]|nr:hypothetical protein [Deltaproteobacteria bacterium]
MSDDEKNVAATASGDREVRAPVPRIRPAGVFRALVVAAVAAAAPVAGCYASDPGDDDAVADADADASADDGTADDAMMPAYGVPDADETTARYAVPAYGTP